MPDFETRVLDWKYSFILTPILLPYFAARFAWALLAKHIKPSDLS